MHFRQQFTITLLCYKENKQFCVFEYLILDIGKYQNFLPNSILLIVLTVNLTYFYNLKSLYFQTSHFANFSVQFRQRMLKLGNRVEKYMNLIRVLQRTKYSDFVSLDRVTRKKFRFNFIQREYLCIFVCYLHCSSVHKIKKKHLHILFLLSILLYL